MSQGRRTALIAIVVLVALFLVAQIIPWGDIIPAFARTNPPVQTQIQWDSPQTEQLVRTACYDCHSNETTWPWYAQIAPFSWVVAHDANEGRQHLNFSTQSADQINPNELIDQIQRGSMPPASYPILHPAANLTAEQKTQLIAGLQASLHGTGEGGSFGGEGGAGGDSDEG